MSIDGYVLTRCKETFRKHPILCTGTAITAVGTAAGLVYVGKIYLTGEKDEATYTGPDPVKETPDSVMETYQPQDEAVLFIG